MNNSPNYKNSQKQELLKKEIIEKNLDKDLFLDYCIQKKESGDDLDNWSFEELKQTIEEFAKLEMSQLQVQKEDRLKKKKIIKNAINEDDKINELEEQSVKYAVR